MSLFEEKPSPKPLAERMRPKSLDEVLGQQAARAMLDAFIESGEMPSLVFWGPPGSGKTSMSRLMAALLGWEGRSLNATSASVKDIRELAEEAKHIWKQLEKRTLLFIDEIHRLNKSQQDVLLPFVEAGTVTLAGSTTENPFFSLNQALRSRVQLVRLEALGEDAVLTGLKRAADSLAVSFEDGALQWIASRASGDMRLAYTTLESAAMMAKTKGTAVTEADARFCLTQTQIAGDRQGDNHYDVASAYQKSMRGSDAEAATYYLARFLASGEDPRFVARRLLITAAEDVGNADPQALLLASAAFRAVEVLGMPEARIPLSQATIYVSRAPKSNETVTAIDKATQVLQQRALDPVPTHLRDTHYKGAKSLGHGEGYAYSHDHPNTDQTFLPEGLLHTVFTQGSQAGVTRPKGAVTAKGQTVGDQDRDQLLAVLRQHNHGDNDWFEVDMDALSERLGWPSAKVRSVLNALAKSQQLTFKRLFKLP